MQQTYQIASARLVIYDRILVCNSSNLLLYCLHDYALQDNKLCCHQIDRLTNMTVLKGADAFMSYPWMVPVQISPTLSAWSASLRLAILNTLVFSTKDTSRHVILDIEATVTGLQVSCT